MIGAGMRRPQGADASGRTAALACTVLIYTEDPINNSIPRGCRQQTAPTAPAVLARPLPTSPTLHCTNPTPASRPPAAAVRRRPGPRRRPRPQDAARAAQRMQRPRRARGPRAVCLCGHALCARRRRHPGGDRRAGARRARAHQPRRQWRRLRRGAASGARSGGGGCGVGRARRGGAAGGGDAARARVPHGL